MKRTFLFLLLVAVLLPAGRAQLSRSDEFRSRYTLKEVVVLSRHNIRSPLSRNGSALARITPHEWHQWTSAPGELSLRGGVLETMMGQYFRRWLIGEELMEENERPAKGEVRFYANSKQRTIATAQYFASGFLPVANAEVEHHCTLETMDPVFHPQLTLSGDAFRAQAEAEISQMTGGEGLAGVGKRMERNYRTLEKVIDLRRSPAALEGDTVRFALDDTGLQLLAGDEPRMTGSLKLANQAADALILQYYEEADDRKAGFGHKLKARQWDEISGVKDWYGDVLFSSPSVAVNVAHPLLKCLRDELSVPERKFSFLCGHDSNLSSVLAALQAEDYSLPQTIEKKTPIGCKLVIEKFRGGDGRDYASLRLVYHTTAQMRTLQMTDYDNPPAVFPIKLRGLAANADGLYPYAQLRQRLDEAIAAYDQLPRD